MNMRPPALDLPIMFIDVRVTAGALTILDGVTLTISPGLPTVLIGPNGAGKTTLLRVAMGLVPASSGLITWGGRESSNPKHRAIMFQRPAMLRRSAGGNVRYALAAAGIPRGKRHERAAALLARDANEDAVRELCVVLRDVDRARERLRRADHLGAGAVDVDRDRLTGAVDG